MLGLFQLILLILLNRTQHPIVRVYVQRIIQKNEKCDRLRNLKRNF
jgi:hypothetical protein